MSTMIPQNPQRLSELEQKNLLAELQKHCNSLNKIGLIKLVRDARKDLGLVDAKNLVENCMQKCGYDGSSHSDVHGGYRLYDELKNEISNVLTPEFTKEQFMSLIGLMIDDAATYFMDPLEAVLHGLQNLKSKGGLEHASRRDETFINKI